MVTKSVGPGEAAEHQNRVGVAGIGSTSGTTNADVAANNGSQIGSVYETLHMLKMARAVVFE